MIEFSPLFSTIVSPKFQQEALLHLNRGATGRLLIERVEHYKSHWFGHLIVFILLLLFIFCLWLCQSVQSSSCLDDRNIYQQEIVFAPLE